MPYTHKKVTWVFVVVVSICWAGWPALASGTSPPSQSADQAVLLISINDSPVAPVSASVNARENMEE
jgi:hypothetical protein